MTNYDKSTLSSNQLKALPIIIASRSVDEACKEIGISRNCYYEWMKLPEFREEVVRLREELVEDAVAQLKTSATKVASTLLALMDCDDFPSVQRAAANDVLNYVIKFKELQEFEKRLNAMEQVLKNK